MRLINDVKHVIEAQQLSRRFLDNTLFPLADEEGLRFVRRDFHKPLTGKEMVSLFVGESTRTRARFEIAMRRLGGEVVFSTEAGDKFSSIAKGESIPDTITIFDEYGVDVIVLRSQNKGDALLAAGVSSIPIINAGDGPGQHPTQALLDAYTIRRYRKEGIDGVATAFIGDVQGGRTVHSLAYILGKYEGVKIYFVSPEDRRIGPNITDYLKEHGVEYHETNDVREIASKVDVFYQTRTQVNLGTSTWDRSDPNHGYTIIDQSVLATAKSDAIIMHPLPCLGEINRREVDDDPRAVYIKTRGERVSQVRCGLFVTSALLQIILSA